MYLYAMVEEIEDPCFFQLLSYVGFFSAHMSSSPTAFPVSNWVNGSLRVNGSLMIELSVSRRGVNFWFFWVGDFPFLISSWATLLAVAIAFSLECG